MQGGNVPWQSSPREHEEDLERARVHFQEFMTATIALTATGQKSYFTMALSLAIPGETRFCKVRGPPLPRARPAALPRLRCTRRAASVARSPVWVPTWLLRPRA